MGKATIVSGGTDGLYSVKIDTGQTTKTARLAAIAARQVQLATELDNAQNALSVQQVIEAMAEAPVAAAIEAYVATTRVVPVVPADVKAALASYTKLSEKLQTEKRRTAPLRANVQVLLDEQTRLAKEAATWTALTLEETASAWCADLTIDAAGAVATIEIPGENKLVLLAPAAPTPTADDGVLTAREVQSGPQAFWNAAVLPGWQKWMPTYRRGTITAIQSEADTADVTLFADDTSSAQRLGINQTPTLARVPVRYMSCNASAFEVGDVCVVKFTNRDWAQPKIVGFVDHPRGCDLVLSGVVRGGGLVTVPAAGAVPAYKVLRAFKPTPNAWQYPLASNPVVLPSDFSDVRALGRVAAPFDTQYADLSPSAYSGLMAKVVAVVMARGLAVSYFCTWALCHGVVLDSAGKPWLVEISRDNGVIAMRLPLDKGSATSHVDAVRETVALLGGLPNGKGFPAPAALAGALASGAVIRLASVADMSPYFDKLEFRDFIGWSMNDSGSEAQNCCYATDGEGVVTSYLYRLTMSIAAGGTSASGSAALTLLAEGPLVIHPVLGPQIGFSYGDESPPPARQLGIEAADITHGPSPLFVCFIDGAFDVVWIENTTVGTETIYEPFVYYEGFTGGRRVYSNTYEGRKNARARKVVGTVVGSYSTPTGPDVIWRYDRYEPSSGLLFCTRGCRDAYGRVGQSTGDIHAILYGVMVHDLSDP